ncbi:MAG: hypothetical protein ACOYUB_03955 [Patescibacteria group bacterium]
MKDKFCVSKSLTYLVALVVAVVAGFYVMNYVNGQKLTTDSSAAGKTCREEGGNWYRDKNCADLASRMGTAFTSVSSPRDAAAWKNFVCCKGKKANTPTPVPVGSQSCSQKGGAWYRDTSAAILQNRLNASSATTGNTATVTEVTGFLTDKVNHPGTKCYKVAYTYLKGNGTTTCKGAGGSGYYRDATAALLQKRLNDAAQGYKATVTVPKGPFTDQVLNQHCYRITYATVADTSCRGQGGTWYSNYSDCDKVEEAWDPTGQTLEVYTKVATTPSDAGSHTGAACCYAKN